MAFKLILTILLTITNAYSMRVVSTSPALTEMITMLGFEKSIIGKTPYCQDAVNAENIGTALALNYEKILALKPDIVFLQENTTSEVSTKLEKLGVKYRSLKIVDLKDLFMTWRTVAKDLNTDDESIRLVETRIKKYASKRDILFVLGGTQASTVMVAGKKTFYDDLAHELGFNNVVKTNGWPVYDAEKIRSLINTRTLVFHFATSPERLWSSSDWKSFCPDCNVKSIADIRLTYPGPLMVEHFIKLVESQND